MGWGWGEAGGSLPLPTRPQRYCDPASLVSLYFKKTPTKIYFEISLTLIKDNLEIKNNLNFPFATSIHQNMENVYYFIENNVCPKKKLHSEPKELHSCDFLWKEERLNIICSF